MKRTKGPYIGSWKNKDPIFRQIKWEKRVNGLGAEFGYNINYEALWKLKFTKFKNKIKKMGTKGPNIIWEESTDIFCQA